MHVRAAVARLLIGGSLLAFAGSAAAAPGDIAYQGCLANEAIQGCTDLPFAPINFASDVAVSPDGKSVYVASEASDSIAHFFRDRVTGQLAYDGCLNNDGSNGCVDLPYAPIDKASNVAVSPDGKSVYVTGWESNAVAHFFRGGPDGQIAYDGCLSNDGSNGCADVSGAPFAGPRGVTVSPDGKSVYVASYANGTIVHLARNSAGGQIAFDSCVDNSGSQSCIDVPGNPLSGARSVAVSPDGRSVYVASLISSSVSHLFRGKDTGKLAWDGCLNNNGLSNCGDLPGEPIAGASGVAVSPDDKSVYVSATSDAVAHFFRSGPDGQIAYDGCLNHDGSQSCADVPGTPFDVAWGVATSSDGRSVYTASELSASVAHLLRTGPDGQIVFGGCLANTTSGGCGDIPFAPMSGARSVAVSPDGRSVYVAGSLTDSIAHFVREPVPPKPDPDPGPGEDPTGGGGPGPAVDTLAPAITGLRVTKPRTTFRYVLSEAATVTVTVQRVLRRGRLAALRPRLTRAAPAGGNTLRIRERVGRSRLRPGRYRAVFTAVDAGGNRSAKAAVRFRVAPQPRRAR